MDDIIRTDEWVYYRTGDQEPFTRLYKRPLPVGVLRSGESEEDGLGVPDSNLHSPRRGANTVPIKTEICPPSTLRVARIFTTHSVYGGDDGLTWVASFHSQAAAKNFVTWSLTHSKSWEGTRPENFGLENPH